MAIGTVKWFNSQRGYGYIQPQRGSLRSAALADAAKFDQTRAVVPLDFYALDGPRSTACWLRSMVLIRRLTLVLADGLST